MDGKDTAATVRRLRASIEESAATVASLSAQADAVAAIAGRMVEVLSAGGKVLTAGNGGSAAEALHLSEELVGRFLANRRSLPAVALVADPTALTCIGNDFGFDAVFSRQIEGLGAAADMLVLFSTSGKARNLSMAIEAAREKGMTVVALLGRDGGPMAGRSDLEIIVPGEKTARIQEAHQVILHLLLEIVEETFSGKA